MTIYNVSDLARNFNISRMTVYRYIKKGMPCKKSPTGRYVFDYEEVENWLKGVK